MNILATSQSYCHFIFVIKHSHSLLTDGTVVKNPPANAGVEGSIPGSEDALEREMATHSNILAWEISWTEEPGRLQFMGSQRVGQDLALKQ